MTNLVQRWRAEEAEAFEREQLYQAYLRGPALRNDPELLKPVKVRVLRPFGIGAGKTAEVGAVVEVAAYVARDVVGFGRAEYVK